MSSRTRAPRARAFKLPVVEEPLFDQKIDEPQRIKAVEPKITTSPLEGFDNLTIKPETVAVPSSEKLVFQVVSIEEYPGFAEFKSSFSNSECDGSMKEESLLSDDDADWYDHPLVGRVHVPPGFVRFL